jgi:hypothetical protein
MLFGFSIHEITTMELITNICCWKTEESHWLKSMQTTDEAGREHDEHYVIMRCSETKLT